MTAYIVPQGFIIVGTCGDCGGPVLAPQVTTSPHAEQKAPFYESCGTCGKVAKPLRNPVYGPLREMWSE